MKNIPRQSNVELLRLVCMLFITCHHFLYWSVVHVNHPDSSMMTDVFFGINGYIYIAVNCFVLISGYFLIRCSARSFFKLYVYYAVYAFACYLFNSISGGSLTMGGAIN